MKDIVLISCVKSKKEGCHAAKELYEGTLYKAHLTFAKEVLGIDEEDIYIISAKHGLVALTDEICKYEKTLNNMSKSLREKWAKDTYIQMKNKFGNLNDYNFIFLAGEKYMYPLRDLLPYSSVPTELQDKLPLGKRIQKLHQCIENKRKD